MLTKHFVSSYRGAFTWIIRDNGIDVGRAESRIHFDPDSPFQADCMRLARETVGCVWSNDFRPEQLQALFPGLCPISFRFTDTDDDIETTVEYHGEKPETWTDAWGTVWSQRERERLAKEYFA